MAKSFRGQQVDMDKLVLTNQQSIAIGNANMNARGDIIGKGGKIIKTREEQNKEFHEANLSNPEPEKVSLNDVKVDK